VEDVARVVLALEPGQPQVDVGAAGGGRVEAGRDEVDGLAGCPTRPAGTNGSGGAVRTATSTVASSGVSAAHSRKDCGVDRRRVEITQIHDKATVACGHSGDAVPATANRDLEPLVATEPNRTNDVGTGGAPDNQRRVNIYHAVPAPAVPVI
jgi:hypothetical protein